MCVSRTRGGTTYGKTYGISPVEANKGDGERERREKELVSVYMSGQTKSDKKQNKSR